MERTGDAYRVSEGACLGKQLLGRLGSKLLNILKMDRAEIVVKQGSEWD
jgi:hypothetical protein